jgi:hypothetical protein
MRVVHNLVDAQVTCQTQKSVSLVTIKSPTLRQIFYHVANCDLGGFLQRIRKCDSHEFAFSLDLRSRYCAVFVQPKLQGHSQWRLDARCANLTITLNGVAVPG